MQSRVRIAACVGLTVGLALGGPAHAALLGATVDLSARVPTTSAIYQDAGPEIVSAAVEYPAGALAIYNASWQVDVTDTSIIITDTRNTGLPFGGGVAFNGFLLRVIAGPELTAASVDAASTFSPADITIVGGDTLELNYVGVSGPSTGPAVSVIDISTGRILTGGAPMSLPEPASGMLLGGTLLGLAALRPRGKRGRPEA
jgi:hypothetical protein